MFSSLPDCKFSPKTFSRLVSMFLRNLLLVSIATVIFVVGFTASSIFKYSFHSDGSNADAIVVLGAAVDNDQPSLVLRERINHAYNLYQTGRARKIILTGGKGEGDRLSEAETARDYLKKMGVVETDLIIEPFSKTTYQNLLLVKNITQNNNLSSFIIVSDPLHMKRAMMMADELGMNAYSSPTPTTMYRGKSKKLGFLAREVYFYLQHQLGLKI